MRYRSLFVIPLCLACVGLGAMLNRPATGQAPAADEFDVLRTGTGQLSQDVRDRIAAAKRVRDGMFRRWRGGEIPFDQYCEWQERYNRLVLATTAKTPADRIRFLEAYVRGAKRIEDILKELYKKGQSNDTDWHIAEYYRLEAEAALKQARGESGTTPAK